MKRRVAILGLDGVGWNAFEKLKDHLTALSLLLSRSSWGSIVTIPPHTPPIWTSILTGVNPGKHGIAGFTIVKRGKNCFHERLATAWDVKHPRLWEIIAMSGRGKSFVYNAPLTYPLNAMCLKNVILVSGWDSPRPVSHPKKLAMEYPALVSHIENPWLKHLRESLYGKIGHREENVEKEFLRSIIATFKRKIESMKEIIDHEEPDFVFILVSETDWLAHTLGINSIKYIAGFINDLLVFLTLNYDMVVIVSDHDFNEYQRSVNVLYPLLENNLIKVSVKGGLWSECATLTKAFEKLANNVFLKRITLGVSPFLRKATISLVARALGGAITINRRESIALPSDGFVGVYLRGKPRHNLRRALRVIYTSLGLKAYDARDVYHGPYLDLLPDVILCPSTSRDSGPLALDVELFMAPYIERRINHHSMSGLVILHAEDASRSPLGTIRPWDVTSIVLQYMGIALPKSLDSTIKRISIEIGSSVETKDYLAKWLLMRKIRRML